MPETLLAPLTTTVHSPVISAPTSAKQASTNAFQFALGIGFGGKSDAKEANAKTHLIGCGENAAPKGSRKIYRRVKRRGDARC